MQDAKSAVGAHAEPVNPFDALLEITNGDLVELQQAYETHRTERNERQKTLMLSRDFAGLNADAILAQLLADPAYVDPRNSLTLWARPTRAVADLVAAVQRRLQELAPGLWLVAPADLHMTVLEIAHSGPAEAVDAVIDGLGNAGARDAVRLGAQPARLVRPLLSIDDAAVALTFVPAAAGGGYSYHHLRRDAWERVRAAGAGVASRYVVPSAHITVARFVGQTDHEDRERMQRWIEGLETANEWLRHTDVEWGVGAETGLVLRKGRVWYGGGETVAQGEPVRV